MRMVTDLVLGRISGCLFRIWTPPKKEKKRLRLSCWFLVSFKGPHRIEARLRVVLFSTFGTTRADLLKISPSFGPGPRCSQSLFFFLEREASPRPTKGGLATHTHTHTWCLSSRIRFPWISWVFENKRIGPNGCEVPLEPKKPGPPSFFFFLFGSPEPSFSARRRPLFFSRTGASRSTASMGTCSTATPCSGTRARGTGTRARSLEP